MHVSIPIKVNCCPHCGQEITSHADDDYLYGSPIRTCPKCGGQYLDKHYHEAAVEGFQESDTSGKAAMKDVLIFGAVMLFLGLANLVSLSTGRIRPAILLIFLVSIAVFFSTLKKSAKVVTGLRKKELDAEMEASVRRLEDKEYAQTLKQLGYAVPGRYL